MKAEIDLTGIWGYDDSSLAEMLNDAIKEELRAAAKRIAKEAVKSMEVEAKAAVQKAVKRDWKKVSAVIDQLNDVK